LAICIPLISSALAVSLGELEQQSGRVSSDPDMGTSSTEEFETFEDYGIAFEYPSDWKIQEVLGDSDHGNVTLYRLDILENLIYTSYITISWEEAIAESYPESFLDMLVLLRTADPNNTDIEVIDSTPITVDGNKAAVRTISYVDYDGHDVHDRYVAFNSGASDRFIRIGYVSHVAFEDAAGFDHIVATLHEIESEGDETETEATRNRIPVIDALTPSLDSPQAARTSINWTASCIRSDETQLFRFFDL